MPQRDVSYTQLLKELDIVDRMEFRDDVSREEYRQRNVEEVLRRLLRKLKAEHDD